MEDITDEAGISKGAFYVHFESKDALIALLIADCATRVDTDYKAFLEALPADKSAAEVLVSLTEKISDVLISSIGRENMNKIYQLLLVATVDTEAVKGYGQELYTLFHGVLEKGIRCGEFISILPADILARHFVMAIREVSYEWCIRYPDFDLKGQAMEYCRLLIEGIQVK